MQKGYIKRGFTLIEIIFYFTIVGTVFLAAMSLSINILDLSRKSDNIHELQASINIVSQRIVSTIRDADSIDDANSIYSDNQGKISINIPTGVKSPTQFYIENNNLYIKEGSSAPIKINSDAVVCEVLIFEKYVIDKQPDQIFVRAEFSSVDIQKQKYETDLYFETTVSLRKI